MLSNPELVFGLSFLAEVDTSYGVIGPRKKLCWTGGDMYDEKCFFCMVGRHDWCEGLFLKINY